MHCDGLTPLIDMTLHCSRSNPNSEKLQCRHNLVDAFHFIYLSEQSLLSNIRVKCNEKSNKGSRLALCPFGRFQVVKYTKHAVNRLALKPPTSLMCRMAPLAVEQGNALVLLRRCHAIRTYHNLRAHLLLRSLLRPRRTYPN